MPRLAVNVDHVATLREARRIHIPDPVTAAAVAELAGADGIVVHLREDRRHIQDRDVRLLRDTVETKLILEMAAGADMIALALEIRPDLVTLVPERREELTTEGGLDLISQKDIVADAVRELQGGGIPVSIFLDPDLDQIELAHRVNASTVEIHTGIFCDAQGAEERSEAFENILRAAALARKLKLRVNAGHGLGYETVKAFKGVSEIDEFSIGHSIIARAVLVGLDRAVRDMVALVRAL